MRFVELVRVSGMSQAARDTPEGQRQELEAFRQARPGTLVACIDPDAVAKAAGRRGAATSGASDSRRDLEELYRLVRSGQVDEVRVVSLDRLSRHEDIRERAEIIGFLREHGVKIVETSGSITDLSDDGQELGADLKLRFAAYERKKITERCNRGRKTHRRQGDLISGPRPTGLTYTKGRDGAPGIWGVIPEAGRRIREGFTAFASGQTFEQVAAIIGVGPTSARHLIRNTIYRGVVSYSNGEQVRVFPPEKQVVPDDIWAAAQRRITSSTQSRRKSRSKTAPHGWLGGLVYCGPVPHVLHTQGPKYYRCRCRHPGQKIEDRCGTPMFRTSVVNGWIDRALTSASSNPDILEEMRAMSQVPVETGERERLTQFIKKADTKIGKLKSMLLDALTDDLDPADIRRKIEQVRTDMVRAQGQLAELEQVRSPSDDAVKVWFDGYRYDAAWEPDRKRAWVMKYCGRIVVCPDGIASMAIQAPNGSVRIVGNPRLFGWGSRVIKRAASL